MTLFVHSISAFFQINHYKNVNAICVCLDVQNNQIMPVLGHASSEGDSHCFVQPEVIEPLCHLF